jgi:hypothetical protein
MKSFPTTAASAILRQTSPIGTRDLLNGNYITVSTPGSAITMSKSVAQLTTVTYHHRGSPRLWIIVPPSEHGKLEARLWNEFRDELVGGKGGCSQFVRHLGLWVTPALLREWDVGFIQVVQEEKQMLFFFPSSYFWGFSTGFGIVEMKAVAGKSWEVGGNRFCDHGEHGHSLCKKAQPNGITFSISQREIDSKETR